MALKNVTYHLLFLMMLCLFQSCTVHAQLPTKEVSTKKTQPNIILIVVDDMRWDEFSLAGHPYLETPHIDQLAKAGARFTNAYHVSPLCSPNRASILTGQYPTMHGIKDNVAHDKASHQLDLYAKDLQQAGYRTAHVGKWHMGNDATPRPGYDYWACLPGQGRTINPTFNENGKTISEEGYVTDVLTDKAVSFIQEQKEQPFFLYIGHKAIHPDLKQLDNGKADLNYPARFIPAPRHEGKYEDQHFPKSKNAFADYAKVDSTSVIGNALVQKTKPEIRAALNESLLDDFTSQNTIQTRAEMLLAVDESLGKIVKTLKEQGIFDNTLLVFTSDNGYFYGEHGLSVERRLPYEESIKSPLIISYPKEIKTAIVKEDFVLSIDYAATFIDVAGLSKKIAIQGISLLPLLKNEELTNWRNSFMVEYYSYENPMPWLINTDYKVIRSGKYKYIHWVQHPDKKELYDLELDPLEMKNLVTEPSMITLIASLQKELIQLIGEANGL